uniref:Uncharacterized protein n=1 Tax=Bracon brevicornis TaxID=1563983 RepID=A0A6V7IJQ1_9HYME
MHPEVFDYLYKAGTEIRVRLNLQEYFSILEAFTNIAQRDGKRLFTGGRLLGNGVTSEQELVDSLRRGPIRKGSSFHFDVKTDETPVLQEESMVTVPQFGN